MFNPKHVSANSDRQFFVPVVRLRAPCGESTTGFEPAIDCLEGSCSTDELRVRGDSDRNDAKFQARATGMSREKFVENVAARF